jgi:hypothetical protein
MSLLTSVAVETGAATSKSTSISAVVLAFRQHLPSRCLAGVMCHNMIAILESHLEGECICIMKMFVNIAEICIKTNKMHYIIEDMNCMYSYLNINKGISCCAE